MGASFSASLLAACNIQPDGSYRYLSDLLRLDAHRDDVSDMPSCSVNSSAINTPLIASAWASNLAAHPDTRFASYIVEGISQGFRIGFVQSAGSSLSSARRNMRSAYENSSVVEEYTAAELDQGRLVGPIPRQAVATEVHLSQFGVIPKRNRPGKWRLIVDLSSPKHASVNCGIDPAVCSLRYSGIDDVVVLVKSLGRGCLLTKLDLQSVYRVIPVHSADKVASGCVERGCIPRYCDTFRFAFCSQDIFGHCRCSVIRNDKEWCGRSHPLLRRLPVLR